MSSIGSSSRARRKNAAGNRCDPGWKYGSDVDKNSKKVKCKFCNDIVNGGVFRFKHHLAGTHIDSKPCISVPNDVKIEMLELLSKMDETTKRKRSDLSEFGSDSLSSEVHKGKEVVAKNLLGKQSTINMHMKKEIKEEACQQIARFFYTSAIPFNCVKNPEFIKIFDYVGRYGPGFKPPSYHEIREKYLKKEVDRTLDLMEGYKLEWKKKGCSIMSDGWTDKKRRSICNFLVNSPKGTVFLSSLDTSDVSKTAAKVYEMLDAIVDDVGKDNVVQIVTDNVGVEN